MLVILELIEARTGWRKQNYIPRQRVLRSFGNRFGQRIHEAAMGEQSPGRLQLLFRFPDQESSFYPLRQQRSDIVKIESLVLPSGNKPDIRLIPCSSRQRQNRFLDRIQVGRLRIVDKFYTVYFSH